MVERSIGIFFTKRQEIRFLETAGNLAAVLLSPGDSFRRGREGSLCASDAGTAPAGIFSSQLSPLDNVN